MLRLGLVTGLLLWFVLALQPHRAAAAAAPTPPAPVVNVHVDPGREIGPIRKELTGIHVAYWHETLFDKGRIEPSALRRLRDAGIGFMVYPGGNAAYSFIWNDVKLPGEVTTEQFLWLAGELGATAKITLNPNASLKLAADWVRYVNHDLQANVTYWEVADEPYLLMSVDQFINAMRQFVPVIKAVDPSIKIVANVSVFNPEYTQRVIREVGHLIDVYSIHILPLPPSKAISQSSKYTREQPEVFFADLLASVDQVHTQLANLRRWVEQLGPQKEVEFHIGSFAPVWWGPEDWTTNSLPAGLWIADLLGAFAKEQVTAAAYWALLNPYPPGQGDFGMLSPEFKPYVAYHAYRLFTQHFGKILVDATDSERNVSAYASLSSDRNDLHLLLINRSPDTPYVVRADLGGFRLRGDGEAWILDGPAIADHPYLYGLRKESLPPQPQGATSIEWTLPPFTAAVLKLPGMNSTTSLQETPNLALDKLAKASSSALHEAPAYYTMHTFVPERAIDGDPDTRWASRIFSTADEWFMVDLGQVQPVNRIVLQWEYWATRYDVEVSTDGVTWQRVATQASARTEGAAPRRTDRIVLPAPVEARYIRIVMTQRPPAQQTKQTSTWTPQAYSLWEVEVYYDP